VDRPVTGQRQPRVRDPDYCAWIAKGPCVACYTLTGRARRGVHVAHLRMACIALGKRETGKAEKPSDEWTLPLCPGHHVDWPEAQHQVGEVKFWAALGIDPFDLCQRLRAAYGKGIKDPIFIISHVAAQAMMVRGPVEL
jgi:hypothetical protein